MKYQTCCFTGHRAIPQAERNKIEEALYVSIEEVISKGVIYFGCGGALGFDTLAAQTVLKLKQKYPHIRLIMVYPCMDQTAFWKDNDIEIYERIKANSDKQVYISQQYDRSCMHKRNRHLIDHSMYCICYLTKPTGGTAYTVKYALQKGLTVTNIAEHI